MANLIVCNLDENIVRALKERAAEHNRCAEAEHRAILKQVLSKPPRKSLAEVLCSIPNVGIDEDFKQLYEEKAPSVFD